MKQILPDIKPTGNKGFTEFLANTFVCDLLSPVYGKSSVRTAFSGWKGDLMYEFSRFTNDDGDILEFFPEGQYVIRPRKGSEDGYQLRTPKTIKDFIDDMKMFGIQLHWSDWVVKKFKQ